MTFCQTPPTEVLINCMPDLIPQIPLINAYLGCSSPEIMAPYSVSHHKRRCFRHLVLICRRILPDLKHFRCNHVFVPWLNS